VPNVPAILQAVPLFLLMNPRESAAPVRKAAQAAQFFAVWI